MIQRPDRREYEDKDEYIQAWKDFYTPIAEFLGMRVIAFDPNVQLISFDRVITLPSWFITRFNAGLQQREDDE